MVFMPDLFLHFDEKASELEGTRSQTNVPVEPAPQYGPVEDTSMEVRREVDREIPQYEGPRGNAQVMHGVYRDGEDHVQDVWTETDRELMRIFPAITEPEHTQILLDIYERRKQLDKVT